MPERTRTPDFKIRSLNFFQLNYRHVYSYVGKIIPGEECHPHRNIAMWDISLITNVTHIAIIMAEEVGVEPTRPIPGTNCFQDSYPRHLLVGSS